MVSSPLRKDRPIPRLVTTLETAIHRLPPDPDGRLELAIFDIDGYKRLVALDPRTPAARVQTLRRAIDAAMPGGLVTPYSTDGFAVTTRVGAAAAVVAAEKVRAAMEMQRAGSVLGTVSVGVSISPKRRRVEPAALVSAAAAALLRAKGEGRNRIVVAEPEAMVMKSTYYPRAQLQRIAAV